MFLRLIEYGLVKSLPSGKGEAFGLCPEALTVVTDLVSLTCPDCGQRTNLGVEEARAWVGQSCPRYRCEGRLQEKTSEPTYYSRIYKSGHTTRVNSREHTGLLTREARESVEEGFKAGGPGDPNLLVCTPTLELGVDVGDLSATMVCSIPPGPANFVQRMGRAGRSTGNAFCLTVALHRPHDLYFYTQPMEMMEGVVRPPSCFLNAPEMLKRQLAAFALDTWAREEKENIAITRHASQLLGAGRAIFPGRAIEYYRANKEEISETFFALFEEHLADNNLEALREFALSDRIPQLLDGAFEALKQRRDELKSQIDKISRRIQQIELEPDSVKDPVQEIAELDDSRRVLHRVRKEMMEKYPLNVLTDEGVLPNYAFPEPGVTLRSVVKLKADGPEKERYDTKEYVRAASSAIREFAPFSKFYADGRRVKIRQIDIGNKNHPLVEKWRFCPDCNYMQRVYETSVSGPCPQCQCAGFGDTGQERNLVPFRRASAYSQPLDTIAVDETEDREYISYHTLNIVDISKENHRGAYAIEQEAFGYELLQEVTLREVNFGLTALNKGEFQVAGQKVNEDGFVVCEECGACEEKQKGKEAKFSHAAYCKYRKGKFQQKSLPVMLYREVTSDAIRILVPSVTHQLETARSSFKAALQLGLRLRFGGDPGHLIIREVSEPSGNGGEQRRNYLVLYDAVPGGTGYLSDLSHDEQLLEVLSLAQHTLRNCLCNRDENADGCYRCLYGYQASRELPDISRKKALELIGPILKARDLLKYKNTLSEVGIESKLESELELAFRDALKLYCEKEEGFEWKETAHGGECWNMKLSSTIWRLETQKLIKNSDGVKLSTRPDFLLTNVSGALDAPTVAVYCDGFAYHACPGQAESRLRDDMAKRQSLINSKKYVVWSLTWDDVIGFSKGDTGKGTTLFQNTKGTFLEKWAGLELETFPKKLYLENSLSQLLHFLENPDPQLWTTYLEALLGASLVDAPFYTTPQIQEYENKLLEGQTLPSQPQAALAKPDTLMAALERDDGLAFQSSVLRESLQKRSLAGLRSYLCLVDDPVSRSRESYKSGWQKLLSTWNLLQFQEGLNVFCLGGLVAEPSAEGDTEAVSAETVDSPEAALDAGLEYLDESCALFRDDILQGLLPPAVVGFEPVFQLRVVGEAELAWPERKVAVILSDELRDGFEKAAWKVYLPEQRDDVLKELSLG